MDAHRAQTAVLRVKADPPDQPGRLVGRIRNARMDIKVHEQRGACLLGVMNSDGKNRRGLAARDELPGESAGSIGVP
jgi:hypothetical protein